MNDSFRFLPRRNVAASAPSVAAGDGAPLATAAADLVQRLAIGRVVALGDADADLEDAGDVECLAAALESDEATLFLLADRLHRLADPRPVLRVLRRLLRRHAGNRLLLSTPDLWSRDELAAALEGAGFVVERMTGSGPHLVAELRADEDSYRAFLARHDLPPPSDYLVVTTEHADGLATGGIGTYHAFVAETLGAPPLLLFHGSHGLPEAWRGFVRAHGWIHVAECLGRGAAERAELEQLTVEDTLLALLHLLFLYDGVRLVEYQDYGGIGVRIAQARRARLIPATVGVVCFAHGSHFYFDRADDALSRDRAAEIDVRERLSLELADCVVFPTEYLRELYCREQGLSLRDSVVQRIPVRFRFDALPEAERGPLDTLAFFGKKTPRKGYDDFCAAVLALFADPDARPAVAQVRRILLIGVDDPDPRLAGLPGVVVESGSLDHASAMARLRGLAANGLVALPYRGDNHPLSLFEVIDADVELIAYAAGGIPEILPEALHGALLCPPGAAELCGALRRALERPMAERAALVERARGLVLERYASVAREFVQLHERFKSGAVTPPPARGAVAVLAAGAPLDRLAAPYVCTQGDGAVPLAGFLRAAGRILDENPEVAAVTSWCAAADDGAWPADDPARGSRTPLGADLGLGLRDNVFGHGAVVYRSEALRRAGWDDGRTGAWQDWRRLLRLTLHGEAVWVIPRPLVAMPPAPPDEARLAAELRLAEALPLPGNQKVGFLRAHITAPSPILTKWRDLQWIVEQRDRTVAEQCQEIAEQAHNLWLQKNTIWEQTNHIAYQQSQIDWLTGALREKDAYIAGLEHELSGVETLREERLAAREIVRLRALEASTFWRMTAGPRRLAEALSRFRQRLRGLPPGP